jgi:hypothetical protein
MRRGRVCEPLTTVPSLENEDILGIVVCQQKSTIWSKYGIIRPVSCYY